MLQRLLTGGRVLDGGVEHRHDVRMHDGRIVEIGPDLPVGDAEVLHLHGQWVVPGLVDLQVNGGHGIDLTTTPERVWELAAHLACQGVTAFLPTLVSCPPQVVRRAQRALADGPPTGWSGAVPVGWHVEGPMLAPARCGAHDPAMLRTPSRALVDDWTRPSGIAMVTLAPELPGAADVVAALVDAGVVVAAGHTEATAGDVGRGVDAGITVATHLFNAMPPIAGRSPGPAAALLAEPRVRVGCIADGVHLASGTLEFVWQAAGPGRLVLVTDAMAATGLGDGRHHLGSQEVVVTDGRATLPDGTLAGSVATLDGCLRHVAAVTGAPLGDVLPTVTTTPADVLGEPTRGRLEVGARADLVVFDDDLQVVQTLVGGEVVHTAAGPSP